MYGLIKIDSDEDTLKVGDAADDYGFNVAWLKDDIAIMKHLGMEIVDGDEQEYKLAQEKKQQIQDRYASYRIELKHNSKTAGRVKTEALIDIAESLHFLRSFA